MVLRVLLKEIQNFDYNALCGTTLIYKISSVGYFELVWAGIMLTPLFRPQLLTNIWGRGREEAGSQLSARSIFSARQYYISPASW